MISVVVVSLLICFVIFFSSESSIDDQLDIEESIVLDLLFSLFISSAVGQVVLSLGRKLKSKSE